MYTKIICSQGFIYWLDLSRAIIHVLCTNRNAENKKYALILSHPALAVDGGEIDFIHLTKGMGMEDLKSKYSAILPVDMTLDFTLE